MTVTYTVTLAVLSVAGLITLLRLVRGPDALNRIVALDVLLTMIIAGAAVGMPLRKDTTTLPVLVVLALLAFTGTVTAAHLIEKRAGLR